MRFQIQMLLVAALCAVLFHGAFSVSNPNSDFADDGLMRSDNEDSDQHPMLYDLARRYVRKVGCAVAKIYEKKCQQARELPLPLERLPADTEEDELDQSEIGCRAAKYISFFCDIHGK